MKKIFLAGALAASMLISSSAFAASLNASYADGKVSVDTSFITTEMINAGKQMTVVVLDGNGSTVTTDTIRYIDQETAAAGIFQAMGLLVKSTETAIPNGTYTVKVGGDDITDLYVGTVTVGTTSTDTREVKFVFGDVNGGEYTGAEDKDISYVDASDALDIIRASVGGAKSKGGIADIGTVVKTKDGKKFVFGDVNGGEYTGAEDKDISYVDASDALDVIRASVGGAKSKGGIADIGTVVTAVFPVEK